MGNLFSTDSGELLIGAFNVQVFGQSKSKNDEVVQVLLKVLQRYDLVLVQEIRDSKGTAFDTLVQQLNDETDNMYDSIISERTGRSVSKEQYGFIFRKDKLEVEGMYDRADEDDVFEREPFVVRFRRTQSKGQQRAFTFIPIHAKPSDAVAELNNLISVYDEAVKRYGDDVVIAGDFNADGSYICKSAWKNVEMRHDPRFKWLIADDVDTTVTDTDCAYDRIVVAGESMQENSVNAKVFHFDKEYNLNEELAEDVSDHYPVEFTLL